MRIIATENKEQEALFQRAQYNPITKEYLFKITNEGKRSVVTGKKLKREGLKAGIPDICLPYPAGPYHACYIELKRSNERAKPTKEQREWIERLRRAGNYANVAHGWEDAWAQIINYLNFSR